MSLHDCVAKDIGPQEVLLIYPMLVVLYVIRTNLSNRPNE